MPRFLQPQSLNKLFTTDPDPSSSTKFSLLSQESDEASSPTEVEKSSEREDDVNMLYIGRRRDRFAWFTRLGCFFFFCTTVGLLAYGYFNNYHQRPHNCADFDTDWPHVAPYTHFVQKRFTLPFRSDDEGNLYQLEDPKEPIYVGPPSPQIDESWNNLLRGSRFELSDMQLSWLREDTSVPPPSTLPKTGDDIPHVGYYGGIDMMHSLHCLNAIRMLLDHEYYGVHTPQHDDRVFSHTDHCIDHLRQNLLCQADASPVTYKAVSKSDGVLHLLTEAERPHTCRDYNAILDWVREKNGK